MSLTITALVIGGNTEHLDETLFGLVGQSRKPDRVMVGCVNPEEEEIAKRHNFPFISIQGSFTEKLKSLIASVEKPNWYWVVFADSCPDPSALEKMALTAETSPSASVVSPKLVDWDHPDKFISFGKTITQLGESFELVDFEMDQGQHDLMRDVLACDFAGSLIQQPAFADLQISSSPMAARSTVFGIRQWLVGKRVLLEPKAKVRLADKHCFDGEENFFGPHFAKRFADYHLSLITLPRVPAFLVWVLIPITSLIRSTWLIGSRRVNLFFPELAAGIGAFASVPNHLKGASELRKRGKLRVIRELRADRAQISDRLRRRYSELPPAQYRPGLLSGPWAWLIPALVILNYRLFPSAEAVIGGNLLPLTANWFELASNGWRLTDGFPTDSLIFPISMMALFSFWAPSSALGWFVFIAPALAFAGSWLALSRFTENRLLVTVLSLGYAVSPIYSLQLAEPNISSTISFALLGWLVHALVMIIQSSVSSRAWRWTAWSAFLMAMISSSTPQLLPVLLLAVFILGIGNLRRAGFLVFVPVLSVILIWPQLIHWVVNPLTMFAPMGAEFGFSNNWELNLLLLPLAAMFLVALVAFVIQPSALTMLLAIASALSVLGFAVIEHIEFLRTPGVSETASANGIPLLLLGYLALLVIITLSQKRFVSISAALVSASIIAIGGYGQITTESGYSWVEYRQVPAIVEVESQRFELNTLVISESAEVVALRQGNGENLGEQSVLADLLGEKNPSEEQLIAGLAGSLIASNSTGIEQATDELSVAFVQLDGNNPAIASQLSRLPELTFAGQTANGALWRVDSTELEDKRIQLSLLQLVPWAAILLTILIAIPTPASIRGRARIRGRK